MNAAKEVNPVHEIVNGLFDRFSPLEIIGILKECENLAIDRFAAESDERQHMAAQTRKVLEEARKAFGVSAPPPPPPLNY